MARSQTPRAARGKKKRRRDRKSVILTVALWTCCFYFLVPLIWLIFASTKNDTNLFDTFGLWFGKAFSLFGNLGTTFTYENGSFGQWLINSAFYALASAVGAVILSTLAGYAFAKYSFTGKSVIFSIVLGSIMIPGTALALPTYLLFAHVDITNTPWAVILPSIVNPFALYLLRIYAAEAVDDSLVEAARIDGAGEFRIFFQISSRLLGPAIVTVFLLALVGTWNNYFLPLIMLNKSSLYPVTVGLAQWAASSNAGGGAHVLFSTVITGSLVSIIPLVLSFLYLQRYWQSGLSAGSVKG
ncbi:sugar ABC transporter permease (plasmid) [Frondihabitans sp. PAMC 28766]|nr:carbohydrate ABC transporter permease [Frondihabitans sp. PAMC 28766]AMM22583.1 sugar ABC transporter permease [Frondihabitans sp. PAMC 28766]